MNVKAIDRIARAQHGVVCTAQLVEVGITQRMIDYAVRTGRLSRVHRGVFRLAGAPSTVEQVRLAAVLFGGEHTLLSHRSALDHWGLSSEHVPLIDVVAPRHLRVRNSTLVTHETRDLPAIDRWIHRGIPVTSVDRTLIDVGRYYGTQAVGKALDEAVQRRHTTYESFERRVLELARPGRNGIGTAREVLCSNGFGDGFGFEKQMRMLIRDGGLPTPTREWRVKPQDNAYFIDFAYPDAMLGIECDSTERHTLPYQIDYDLRRQNEIVRSGVMLLRYPYNAVRFERDRVIAEIREQLTARGGGAS